MIKPKDANDTATDRDICYTLFLFRITGVHRVT